MNMELLKTKIEKGIPGCTALILDPRHDGKHLKAVVTFSGFEGKSLIEQHRMVYGALKEEFSGSDEVLHALAIETRVQ